MPRAAKDSWLPVVAGQIRERFTPCASTFGEETGMGKTNLSVLVSTRRRAFSTSSKRALTTVICREKYSALLFCNIMPVEAAGETLVVHILKLGPFALISDAATL